MTAVAGLLLTTMEIGVLLLRNDIPEGFRLRDDRRPCFKPWSLSRPMSDLVGPNMGERMSIESGGLVGRDES